MPNQKEFKYDVIELIRAIEIRPCLWDKTLENYKDRLERRQAWEEIFATLEHKYESMSAEEKRITGEHILNKWTNVRDTFVKSLRVKTGKPKKRYIFHKYLKFLIKVIEVPEEDNANISTITITNTEHNDQEESDVSVSYLKQEREDKDIEETSTSYNYNTRKRKKTDYTTNEEYVIPMKTPSKSYDHHQSIDFVEVDENESRVMNEDEAFFASLLPTVVKYNEDERLEFRIEVLGVMKKIKERRNWGGD